MAETIFLLLAKMYYSQQLVCLGINFMYYK